MAVAWKTVNTYPIADNEDLTAMDPVSLTSGKVQQETTNLSTDIIGFSTQTISMGVLSTVGQQEYVGVVSEGLIELTGLVEGSGSTYTSAISIGDTVSMYWDGTTPYAVNSASGPVGIVVDGSVASSGTAADTTGTITVQIDLASYDSDLGAGNVTTTELADNAVTAPKLAANACTGTKLGDDIVSQVTSSTLQADFGNYTMNGTESTLVVDFGETLTSTENVNIQLFARTNGSVTPTVSNLTDTNFTISGTTTQAGTWLSVEQI